ncbi:MAG: dioxygenase, partial [Firmicutes bacterium]|nr:dioxygenase [Bacillota bacterium]
MALVAVWYAPNTPTLVGDLGVDHPATRAALRALGAAVAEQVEVVAVVSPHFVTGGALGLVAGTPLKQLFDFWGFPPEFYQRRYPAPGAPGAAARLLALAAAVGVRLEAVDWGLDHGAWAPLWHLFPAADVPVLPLSIAPDQ